DRRGGDPADVTEGRMAAAVVPLLVVWALPASLQPPDRFGERRCTFAAGGLETGIRGPTKLKDAVPVYPSAARKVRKTGTVELAVTILPSGETWKPTVIRGVDADLDRAAVEAVEQWRYAPLTVDGRPCWTVLRVNVRFRLSSPAPPAA